MHYPLSYWPLEAWTMSTYCVHVFPIIALILMSTTAFRTCLVQGLLGNCLPGDEIEHLGACLGHAAPMRKEPKALRSSLVGLRLQFLLAPCKNPCQVAIKKWLFIRSLEKPELFFLLKGAGAEKTSFFQLLLIDLIQIVTKLLSKLFLPNIFQNSFSSTREATL